MQDEPKLPSLNRSALAKTFTQVARDVEAEHRARLKPFLRFTKQGRWVLGREGQLIPDGTEAVVPLTAIALGYVAWFQRQVEAEVMKPVVEGRVDPSSLPPVQSPDGWQPQAAVGLILPDGTEAQYKTSTRGGLQAVSQLIAEVGELFAKGEGPADPDAVVVVLESSSYTHRKYGETFVPVLRAKALVKMADVLGQQASAELPQDETPW